MKYLYYAKTVCDWPYFCDYCQKRWYICAIAGKPFNEEITAYFLLSKVIVKSFNMREAACEDKILLRKTPTHMAA